MKTLVAWDDLAEAELLNLYLNTDGSPRAVLDWSPLG